jgi:hypothetical protein
VVLVLLVVPALLAMQQDIRRQFQALRRALSSPRRSGATGSVTVLASSGSALIFAATLGHAVVLGALWPPLLAVWPVLAGAGAVWPAFGLFVALSGLWLLAVFVLAGSARLILARRPAAAPLPPAE